MAARALGAILALMVSVLPSGGADAALPRHLTLSGNGNGYAILTVTEETTYLLDHTMSKEYFGRWAGFVIDGDWPQLWSVYHTHAVFKGLPARRPHPSSNEGVLPPGSYRVYLFADGPTTIKIPWSGRNTTLEFDAPLDARVAIEQARAVNGPVSVTVPQDGGPGTVTTAARIWSPHQELAPYRLRQCFARNPASRRTCDRRYEGWGSWLVSPNPLPQGSGNVQAGPFAKPTTGLSWFAEIEGAVTGTLTLATIRYQP